jgi:hypothetical protein
MLGLTSCPLAGICVPFWVHLGELKYPRQHKENYHLVVLDHFSWNNGPNDLVRGLFLSLYFGPYIPPFCGPLCAFLGLFGGAPMLQNSIKNYCLLVSDYLSYKIGLIDLVMVSLSSLDIGTYIPPTCGPLCMFLGIREPPNRPTKVHKAYRWAGCMAQSISFKMGPFQNP